MNKDWKIFVAGHRGLVGSALVAALRLEGYENFLLIPHANLDLTNQQDVDDFFKREKPDAVFLCAARVGGIVANDTYPAEFIGANLAIQTNVIHSAWQRGVKKLMFVGSGCIYPRECPQPIRPEYLFSGPLEKTNEWYAVAKIAGLKMCQAYKAQYGMDAISIMPANLYGPRDNFDLETSHVVPALIRKFHEAKVNNAPTVTVWGTGKAQRELLHIHDLASASIYLMNNYSGSEQVHIGSGEELTISELATLIGKVVGYNGTIVYDHTKPDGTPRKLLDSSILFNLGWRPSIALRDGLLATYEWFKQNADVFREVKYG